MSTLGELISGVPVITPGAGLNNYGNYGSAIQGGIGGVQGTLGNQSALAQILQRQAQGLGPSVAQQQFQQNNQRVAAQAAGTIAGQKGINPGLGAQIIARNQAAIQGQGAGEAALARTQEQLGAQGQLGQLYGQMGQEGLGLGNLGTQGQQGQNQQYIEQQQIAAGQNAQNENIGEKLLGTAANAAGSALGVGATHKAHGGTISDYRWGGMIPGMAKVQGDSPKNDTVPIMASPDEIMLPRSVTQSPNAGDMAKAFVEAILAKKAGGKRNFNDGGTVDGGTETPLPAPPLIRADKPLPYHGGTFDRYSPYIDQLRETVPYPSPSVHDEPDAGPHRVQFAKGGNVNREERPYPDDYDRDPKPLPRENNQPDLPPRSSFNAPSDSSPSFKENAEGSLGAFIRGLTNAASLGQGPRIISTLTAAGGDRNIPYGQRRAEDINYFQNKEDLSREQYPGMHALGTTLGAMLLPASITPKVFVATNGEPLPPPPRPRISSDPLDPNTFQRIPPPRLAGPVQIYQGRGPLDPYLPPQAPVNAPEPIGGYGNEGSRLGPPTIQLPEAINRPMADAPGPEAANPRLAHMREQLAKPPTASSPIVPEAPVDDIEALVHEAMKADQGKAHGGLIKKKKRKGKR